MKYRIMLGCVAVLTLIASAAVLTGCTKPTTENATPTPAASSSPFKVGQPVAATWTDGNFWLAKVTAVDGDQIEVQFADDQSKLKVPAADIQPIEEKNWAVGSDVLAVWTSGRFYPGQITEADGTTYTVKWQDGSEPSKVTSDKIISVP